MIEIHKVPQLREFFGEAGFSSFADSFLPEKSFLILQNVDSLSYSNNCLLCRVSGNMVFCEAFLQRIAPFPPIDSQGYPEIFHKHSFHRHNVRDFPALAAIVGESKGWWLLMRPALRTARNKIPFTREIYSSYEEAKAIFTIHARF